MPITCAPTPEAEMEVIARLDRQDGQAHICSCWPAWTRKLGRLYGPPVLVSTRQGKVTAAWWTVPLDLVTLRRPKKPRVLTEAQREVVRTRLRASRTAARIETAAENACQMAGSGT